MSHQGFLGFRYSAFSLSVMAVYTTFYFDAGHAVALRACLLGETKSWRRGVRVVVLIALALVAAGHRQVRRTPDLAR